MLNNSQVWRRQFACFTASLCAAMQPVLMHAQEPALPLPLLAENAAPAPAAACQRLQASRDHSHLRRSSGSRARAARSQRARAAAVLATPSQNVTLNLINRLVQKGVLSQAEAADLIQGAEEDAAFAKAQAQALADTQAAVMAQGTMPPVEPDPDEVRVTYIPESVKAEIRDQLRAEVFAQAREQKWAAPNSAPEWTQRIRMFGDIRMRYDSSCSRTATTTPVSFPTSTPSTPARLSMSPARCSPRS
jgi:hypothetical protein